MDERFTRTERLVGAAAMERLAAARVIVFGVGGVGGYVVEALARSGVGAIDVVDPDRVSVTNINRQLLATTETIGESKAEVARARILSINPACRVRAYEVFYLPETAGAFDLSQYDYVVDAIDTVAGKLALIENAEAAGVPIISSMGAGNKLDPTAFRVADIYQTSVCPLARVIRGECRRRGIRRLKVVYSEETPHRGADVTDDEEAPAGRRAIPSSIAFVPSVAGLIAAGEVIRDLIRGGAES